MKKLLKNPDFDYAWWCTKIPMALVWAFIMFEMTGSVNRCLYPAGICRLYSFEPLFTPTGKYFIYASIVISLIAYLLEKGMILTTLTMFFISLVVISFHESNGIYYRATVLSPIWGVQCLAYWQHKRNPSFNLAYYRQQYVWQIVAASYTLAGLAKIYHSGFGWINAGPSFYLQVIKNYAFMYFDNGSITNFNAVLAWANKPIIHSFVLKILLGIALVLEIGCFSVLVGKKVRIVWGIGLLLMHIFIATVMGIGISVIAFPMIFFFLNPLYMLLLLFNKLVDHFLLV